MKILRTSEFGAGWSTWQRRVPPQFSTTYIPIIDALERGEKLNKHHPIIKEYVEKCKELFESEYVCVLGCDHLIVDNVEKGEDITIQVYDGYESIHYGDGRLSEEDLYFIAEPYKYIRKE